MGLWRPNNDNPPVALLFLCTFSPLGFQECIFNSVDVFYFPDHLALLNSCVWMGFRLNSYMARVSVCLTELITATLSSLRRHPCREWARIIIIDAMARETPFSLLRSLRHATLVLSVRLQLPRPLLFAPRPASLLVGREKGPIRRGDYSKTFRKGSRQTNRGSIGDNSYYSLIIL